MDLSKLEEDYKKKEGVPECSVGDTVRVAMQIEEGGKKRVQAFQGTVIARKGGGLRERIWVRKVTRGLGVEKMFLLHSPAVQDIRILRKGKVRRAKLYYLRNRIGKKAKVKAAK